MQNIIDLSEVGLANIDMVGGKNASIGEMINHLSHLGIKVPGGIAITATAYRTFLSENHLNDAIRDLFSKTKLKNLANLKSISLKMRKMILQAPFSLTLKKEIANAYIGLSSVTVAVRSSATAEDLPTASFAGQQETYLNVKGLSHVLTAIKLVYASLFTERAVAYRQDHQFDHLDVAMSVGIQPMVRSDRGTSGVMFTLDTESGFDQVILITASYGLGEGIVQGGVVPDEFYVFKPVLIAKKFSILQRKLGTKHIKMIYAKEKSPDKSTTIVKVPLTQQQQFCISDEDIKTLATHALTIEKHYGKPMDIEWAKDGLTGEIFILQARPETVKSLQQGQKILEQFKLSKRGKVIITGQSVGQRIGYGRARIVDSPKNIQMLIAGSVLITDMTDPDWEPMMKHAAAIVTNRGGRTCHAAIVARELGIPAIVGCGNATEVIKNNSEITVSCAEGQTGFVYEGKIPFKILKTNIKNLPEIPVKLCVNIGNPLKAFTIQFLPNHGVGLARLEFIINHMIGIHPNALIHFSTLPRKIKKAVQEKIVGYKNPKEFYIERLREGIATITAAFYPKEVIFRFSDFKSNEYANLLGGYLYEPKEENPMLGFRGASRYINPQFQECFKLECLAFKRVRQEMNLTNAHVMIPFVRTVDELKKTLQLMQNFGLKRGVQQLKIYMMCELPVNVLLAKEFLTHIDGYSIGSNDLTQLTLGVDRDSNLVASSFDERHPAVKKFLHHAISQCHQLGKYVSICGQGPSDHEDFTRWLLSEKIQAISLNPDVIVDIWLMIAEQAQKVNNPPSNLISLELEIPKSNVSEKHH